MSRLSPLIVRRAGPFAPALPMAAPSIEFELDFPPPEWMEDVRRFVTLWLGGLVFFGTFLA